MTITLKTTHPTAMNPETSLTLVRNAIRLNGEWVTGENQAYTVINPATGEPVQEVNQASTEQAEKAIEFAHQAWELSGWRSRYPHERARVLHQIAALIDDNAERLAQIQTLNTGKVLAETRALVSSAANTFRYYAAAAETQEGSLTTQRGPWQTQTVFEPLGVIAAITPWNSPIASDAQKIAPALAAGNAVVVKPAEWTPLVSMALMELIVQSDLPDGLVTVLPGKGSVIGNVITSHPKVRKIAFTGGTNTGRSIAHQAAERLIPVTLELGGKSPTIVLEDADLEQALQGVLYGIFSSSGQSCIAGSRLFVHRSIYREFVDELVQRAKALNLGPGSDPETDVGPLVHTKHRDSVAAYVEQARTEGGTILCGGRPPEDPALVNGSYYEPTIIEGLTNSSLTAQEEIFGPVLVCIPFTDDEDLVEQANDTVFGLAAGIWTPNFFRAQQLAERIDAGTIWINTYKQFSTSTPFTGFKDSGLGLDKGRAGLAEYSKRKSLYWGTREEAMTWGRHG